MMPKSDTISAIIEINPSANPSFLAEFSNQELEEYLHRLRQVPRTSLPLDQAIHLQAQLVAAVAPSSASGAA